MHCYQCAKTGTERQAVAACRSCNAGLCMTHLKQTAAYLDTGTIRTSCDHDTWFPLRDPVAVSAAAH
jgi:hypothetical protein